ncbi:MAG TPA: hypothetical protein VFD37_05755 [Solirubrobacterales bacterium]|nr:hypothetical protein [Solirubrobacterales bacterium]
MTYELKNARSIWALLAIAVLLLALALPAQALAEAGDPSTDPTASQYEDPSDENGDEDGSDEGGVADSSDPGDGSSDEEIVTTTTPGSGVGGTSDSSDSGSLPFTGFDAGVLAVVALLLGGTGLALRKFSAVR